MGAAEARRVCAERDSLVSHLGERFGEVPWARGLTAAGTVIEVLASPEESWTIIVISPSGTACIVAAGQAWTPVSPLTPSAGSPT